MKKSRASKTNERLEALMRLPVGFLSGVILYVWGYLVLILAIINWLCALITNRRNEGIGNFVEYWNTESYLLYRYLTGVSNARPFPFSQIVRISRFG